MNGAIETDEPGPSATPPAINPLAFFPLARGFWRGRTALLAWSLCVGLLGLVIVNVVVQVLITHWHASFFNALEQRHADRLIAGISQLAVLALSAALIAALIVWLRMRLQIAWRGWLSDKPIHMWLGRERFAHLAQVAPKIDAPEFRIAQDVQVAVEPLVEFAVGLANSLLSATAFIVILWTVGGSISLPIAGGIVIPGFMVWVAVAYAVISSRRSRPTTDPRHRAQECRRGCSARLDGPDTRGRPGHRPGCR